MKFAAHYIITGTGEILPKGIVEVDKEGRITDLISNENGLREQARHGVFTVASSVRPSRIFFNISKSTNCL